MYFKSEKLKVGKELEKKIISACEFNSAKVEIISGSIITIENTNISYIEPNKAIVTMKNVKLVLIYYDNDNLFIFNRYNPLKVSDLRKLIENIRLEIISEVQNG